MGRFFFVPAASDVDDTDDDAPDAAVTPEPTAPAFMAPPMPTPYAPPARQTVVMKVERGNAGGTKQARIIGTSPTSALPAPVQPAATVPDQPDPAPQTQAEAADTAPNPFTDPTGWSAHFAAKRAAAASAQAAAPISADVLPPAYPAPSLPATDPTAPVAAPSKFGAAAGLPIGESDGGTDDEDARQQALRDQAANNRRARSLGAQMETDELGNTHQAVDANGTPLYKAQVISPFTRLDDGEAYRVSRDQFGAHHYYRIADGADGTDFHTDPHTGEQYVQTSGDDGQSRRQIVGQNYFIPAANTMRAVQEQHQTDAQTAAAARDDAERGVAGAAGYGGLPLANLRAGHNELTSAAARAQRILDAGDAKIAAYTSGQSDEPLTGAELQAYGNAKQTLAQYGPHVDALTQEIGSRESAITQARQQQDASTRAMREAADFHRSFSTPEGQTAIKADLGTAAFGGNLDPRRATQLQQAGLLNADGSVTDPGKALLSGRRPPRADATQPPPVAGAGQNSSTPTGQPSTQGPAATPAPAPSPANTPQTQGAATAKPYTLAADGSVHVDPASPTSGLLAAYKDGKLSDDKLKTLLPVAMASEKAGPATMGTPTTPSDQTPPQDGPPPNTGAVADQAAHQKGEDDTPAPGPAPEGFWTTAGRALASKLAPAVGTAAGGVGAGFLAIPSGPGAIAADIAGGTAGGLATDKLQRSIMGEDWAKQNDAQMEANAAAHPVANQIGSMIPFLVSLLGGGGLGKAAVNGSGKVIGRAFTSSARTAMEDAAAAGTKYMAPTLERIAQGAAGGARAGASEGAQQKYVEGKDVSVLDSAARSALSMGAPGIFSPAVAKTAVGLFPAAKALLTEALGRGVKDAAAMTLAGNLYDSVVHGKQFDLSHTAQELGGDIPAFVLQNVLMGFFHARMPALASEGGGPGEPGSAPPAGDTPVRPPTDGEHLDLINQRLDEIQNSPDHADEVRALEAQRGTLEEAGAHTSGEGDETPSAPPAQPTTPAPAAPPATLKEAAPPIYETLKADARARRADGRSLPGTLQGWSKRTSPGSSFLDKLTPKQEADYTRELRHVADTYGLSLTLPGEQVASPSASPASTRQPVAGDTPATIDDSEGSTDAPTRPSADTSPDVPTALGEPQAQPSTQEGLTTEQVIGDKINARRSAFSSESGTLGIPRDEMPQVAAVHRGAFANFLKGRGIDLGNDDVLPGDLRPSQGDFNPGKVAKAGAIREAGDSNARRILVSNDNHVIDGHHQWLDRLTNTPDQPMPVLRINAPATEILSQVHEFPSAGMENAPDIPEHVTVPRQQGDTAKMAAARAWLSSERAAGRDPSAGDLHRKKLITPQAARQIVADQNAAETAPAQGVQSSPTTAPETRQPSTPKGKQAARTLDRLRALRDGGTDLNGGQRYTLRNAELTHARDLNEQVLGPDAPPTTEAGQRAQRVLAELAPHIPKMSQSQMVEVHGHRMAVENDRTAQRRTIEARNEAAKLPVRSEADNAGAALSPEEAQAVHGALDEGHPIAADVADDHGVILPPDYVREGDNYVLSEEPLPVSDRAQGAIQALQRLREKQRAGEPLTPGDLATARHTREAIDEERRKDRDAEAAASAPPTAESRAENARAEQQYRAELEEQAHEGMEGAGGTELLTALREAGGLPTDDPVFRGELERVRQASQAAHLAGRKGTWNVFRSSAPALDELTSRLREQGFDFATPADMLDAIERRVASQKPEYGFPARNEAQSGMEQAGAYYRRQAAPEGEQAPRTPEELQPAAEGWRTFLQKVAPKTALRLEVIAKEQLGSLWKGQGRVPDDVHAAYMDGTMYLVHEALASNPGKTNVVNLLHEAAHSYERTLPETKLNALRRQWQESTARKIGPLFENGQPRADVDQRAFDTSRLENFSEWLAERLAWENAEWAAGRAKAKTPAQRTPLESLAAGLRDLFLRVYHALGFGKANLPAEADRSFRQWLKDGTPGVESKSLDGAEPQAALRDWFKRFGRQESPETHGQQPAREVGSEREDAASQAGLDPVTGTPLDPEFERAIDEYHRDRPAEGGRGGAAPDPAVAQLEGNPVSDAGRTVRTAGGEPPRDSLVRRAGNTGLAIKEFVARFTGERNRGVRPGSAHDDASSLLTRATDDPALSSEERTALAGIRPTVPLIREGDFLRHVDAAHLLRWINEQETEGRSLEGLAAVRHTQSYADSLRTLRKLFPARPGEKADLAERLAQLAKEQAASGQRPRLQVLGVGGEGTVFQDLDGRGTYKIHPGGAAEAAQGIRSIRPDEKGTGTHVEAGTVPATEAALRYLRQSSLPVSSPTEIKGITENGRLITRQPLLDASNETTPAEIDAMMARAGGRRIQVRGQNNALRNSFAVPDGRGNWMMAVDMKPANVLRDRAMGEPRLTDGILSPITPEVLADNPQLADYPANNPAVQFARRATARFDEEPLPARGPISADLAESAARRQVEAHQEMLAGLSVRDVRYEPNTSSSGVQMGDDGVLRIEPAKLARALANVRDARNRTTPGTAEDWFNQVLAHEGIHGAQFAVAREKGLTLPEHINASLPDEAMPAGYQIAGRRVYGGEAWDELEPWAQKSEFVRMVIENRWKGKIGEQLHSYIKSAVNYLKQVAGFQNADPRFKAHVDEIEARINALRDGAKVSDTQSENPQFARRTGHVPENFHPVTDEERNALRIPPAWSEVHVADDPSARRLAVGKDAQGRTQSVYSTAHTGEQQAAKFQRLQAFDAAIPRIMERIRTDADGNGPGREEAAVLRLIQATGFRNGGDAETGGKVKAYGASNLRAEHVTFDGDTARFDFPGKLGVRQQHEVTSPELVADLRARAAKGGALFDTTAAKVLDYLKQDGDYKVHDFRTRAATQLAAAEVARTPEPTSAEEFWNQRDRIGDLAAKKLGDTRAIALGSYVDPAVFESWKSNLGITDEARPRRTAKAPTGKVAAATRPDATRPGRESVEGSAGNDDVPQRPATGPDAAEVRAAGRVDDAPPRIEVPRQPGDTDKMARARTWVADERAAGRTPTPGQISRKIGARFDAAQRIIADHEAAEAEAGKGVSSTETPAAEPQFARRGLIDTAKAVRDEINARDEKKRVSAGVDTVENRAGQIGRQAANSVRQEFGTEKELAQKDSVGNRDLAAMPFVVEAHGNVAEVRADLAKVKASKNPALAKDLAPVVQHAIDHFARLDAKKGRYETTIQKQVAIEANHGISPTTFQGDVMRRLELPGHERTLEPILFGKSPRYIVAGKQFDRLADAIEAGYKPTTTNLADLLQQRVTAGQQMVQSRRLYKELKGIKVPGDPAGRSIIADPVKMTLPNGKTEEQAPIGYEKVDAAGVPLIVHKRFAPLVRDLYAESAIQNRAAGRIALQAATFAKHGTFIADTFHAGRMMYKQASGGGGVGWEKGVALLEHGDDELARRVASGEIPQSVADWAKANRPAADELVKAGLNVGQFADNLLAQVHGLVEKIPGVAKVNNWVFNKVSRGAMIATALKNYERNLARFPELGREGAARRTAGEMNQLFGNLGRQGILKSQTMRDLARLLFIAPQWVESQIGTEVSTYKQAGMVIPDALRGRMRVGNLVQQAATGALGMVALAQVINYFTRGQPTWKNKEEGHALDAYIPGGRRGFFFAPMSMVAEYTHDLIHYYEKGEGPVQSAVHIAENKLAPMARGAYELATNHDMAGKQFPDATTRVRAGLIDAIPSPLPASMAVEKDPRGVAGSGPVHDIRSAADKVLSPIGYRVNRQPGSVEKQLLASIGLKVTPAPSATSQMFDLARGDRPAFHSDQPSKYTQLRQAIENGDEDGAEDELRALMHDHGMTPQQIGEKAFQIRNGKIGPQVFTGSKDGDKLMLARFNPEQRKLYAEAQQEHQESALAFQRIVRGMGDEPATHGGNQQASRDQAMAILALRNGNLSLVNTLLDQGKIKREDLPTLRKQAKAGAAKP